MAQSQEKEDVEQAPWLHGLKAQPKNLFTRGRTEVLVPPQKIGTGENNFIGWTDQKLRKMHLLLLVGIDKERAR
jgi:hypothetical protein